MLKTHTNLRKLIQILLTIFFLWLVLRKINLLFLLESVGTIDVRHLLMAFIFAGIQFVIGIWRWQKTILLVSGQKLPSRRLFNSYLKSFFVNSILPGTITGDIVRIYDTRDLSNNSAMGAFVVFLERALGFFILIFVGISFYVLFPSHPHLAISFPPWMILTLLIICVTLLIVGILFHEWINKIISLALHWLNLFADFFPQLPYFIKAHPFIAFQVLLGTVIFTFLSVLVVYEALMAAQVEISFPSFFAVASIVMTLLIIPFSIQGIGLREYLYVTLLTPYSIQSESVLLGLALTYLIGMPFILWGWVVFSRQTTGSFKHDITRTI
jgi:uncharacterized membrane protein YbhN (UPF0104 family)